MNIAKRKKNHLPLLEQFNKKIPLYKQRLEIEKYLKGTL